MVMKRATAELVRHGFDTLQINKGVYGYYVTDKRWKRQRGTIVRKTTGDCILDILAGSRPVENT